MYNPAHAASSIHPGWRRTSSRGRQLLTTPGAQPSQYRCRRIGHGARSLMSKQRVGDRCLTRPPGKAQDSEPDLHQLPIDMAEGRD